MFLAAVIAGFMGGPGSTPLGYTPVYVNSPSCGLSVGQVQTADPYGIAPLYCGNVRLESDTVLPQ